MGRNEFCKCHVKTNFKLTKLMYEIIEIDIIKGSFDIGHRGEERKNHDFMSTY